MLHVFNVNFGRTMTFDVNLAMDRVAELKNAIAKEYSLHQDKQVMLISGGQALSDDERVCSYAAGTETNPVYLFDKACIEKETLPSCAEYQQDKGFNESIATALSLNPSYKTVEVRTKLAIRLSEATSRQVACMKSLVHDEHLMYQGWQAAVANLQDTVVEFKERVEAMCAQCEKLFHQGNKNGFVMKGLEEILHLLEKIPVFPSLLKKRVSITPMNSVEEPLQFSLLRWIESQCKNISIQSLFNECKQKETYLSQEKYCGLLEECRKVELQTGNGRMTEISGINERLAALDHLIITAEQQVKEQIGIAQGFIRNRETVSELQNHRASIDALNTLCESHVTQLRLMQEYEASAREALKKCTDAKNELAANLHTRLRWLYFMQRSVLNADVKLSMFTQQLCHLQHQISFLDQVKLCPSLYLVSVAEVVRRKQFATQYINWANGALSESQVERDREIVKRKTFHSNLSGHFIQRLFHGLSDRPPSLARKPLRSFDTKLPNITHENLSKLLQLLPMYKDTIEEQDLFSTKDTSRNSIASEESITEHGNINSLNAKGSVSITLKKGEGKSQVGTGSFAMVNAAHIGQSQPGGFVVTSVEGLTQETLERGFPSYHGSHTTESPPHRSHSSPVIKDNDATPLPSLSPGSRSDSVFAPIGDIISPDSPPDSDFYSIMPGNFSFPPKTDDNRENLRKASIASSNQSFVEMSSRYELSEKMPSESFRATKIQSHLLVGSPDSNSSTSYQKVDGVLSSDEEMFHSFTSDHGKDLKSMRKKLHQLQEEYDNLAEESKREKEDLNATAREMQQKMREMEANQQTVEADFERRWEETKSELDDVIKQLECERVERKKAWTEGANLEKNLKEARDSCLNCQQKLENLELELQTKTHEFQNLESTYQKFKVDCSEKVCEEEIKYNNKLAEVRLQHEQELQTLEETLSRLEKDVTLAQTELATSEDRIQELETELSQREQVQQETDIHTLELESEIKSLQQNLILSQDSLSKCKEDYETLEKKNHEMKAAHTRAEEQVASLKCILADFETKLNDDRSKDGQLKNLKVQVQQIELEKFEIATALKTSEELADSLNKKMQEMQKEIQSVRSLAMKDAQDHLEEFEKLKMAHAEQLEVSTTKQQEDIKELSQQHDMTLKMLQEEHAKILEDKLGDFESEMTKIKSIHINELDEVETDRLEAVASAQQTIEDLRSKLRDAHRSLDTEQKESQALKEDFEKEREEWHLKLECLLREADEARGERSYMEEELVKCRETIANLQEKKQQENLAQSTLLGSSMMSSTDEEMESKRSKLDSGISEEMVASLVSKEIVHKPQNIMAMSMEDHEKAIGVLRKNFEEDKKALQSYFKKREEEAARRRQMVFNSAIQRVTSSKDLEIQRLKSLVMSQSQATPAVTQSMMAPSSQPMVSPETQVHPSPPIVLSQSAPEKDKVTVSSFHVGDIVLITYNEKYQHFTLLTTSHTLYFVHGESLEKLGLYAAQEFKRSMIFACLTEKEYCQARKAQNRFHVPINTKFYRVKVVPVTKKE